MNTSDASTAVRDALARVAPDVDLDTTGFDVELQADLDLDSVDFLNLVTALHEATGIDIPERDYGAVATVAGLVDYLARH